MSKIEQIIEDLQAYVSECKSPAFSGGGKIVCERNTIEEFIEDLRLSTPEEIKKYQKIISQKDMILADAKSQSSAMIAEAQREAQKLVDDHEIMQKAYEEAQKTVETAREDAKNIVDAANRDGNDIRNGAIQYTDSILADLQTTIENAVTEQEARNDDLVANLKGVLTTVTQNRDELNSDSKTEASIDISTVMEEVEGGNSNLGSVGGSEISQEDGEIFLKDSFDSEE